MKSVMLGKTGVTVGELGMGAMCLPRLSHEESDRVLTRALELGITYFDTAAAYQDSEEKLGRILSRRRRNVVVASRSMAYRGGPQTFEQEFEQSLRRLGMDFIDFYGFHAVNQPGDLKLVMGAPLAFLKKQQEKGTVGHIAVTGHNPVTLTQAVQTGEFAMVMFPFNIIEQEPLEGLLDAAGRLGVATSIMKPLAGGVIENKALALRFFFAHSAGVVTPGMDGVSEIEENAAVFEERRPLSPQELKLLQDEVAALGKAFCRRCSYCMPCPNGIMIPFAHMIHQKCFGKPLDDDVAYTLGLGRRMLPALEQCTACGECVEKCPYHIPTPQRVKELLELLQKPG